VLDINAKVVLEFVQVEHLVVGLRLVYLILVKLELLFGSAHSTIYLLLYRI